MDKTHWNYRLCVTTNPEDGIPRYGIHECYYPGPNKVIPTSWTKDPVSLEAEDKDWLIKAIRAALEKPVIDLRGSKPRPLYSEYSD